MAETFRVLVPPQFTSSDRVRFGEIVINYIINRSKRGLGIGNSPLGKYSKSYKQSAEFEIAGKTGNTVNLTLTGDMLDSLDIISHNNGFITIGYKDGTDSNDKAKYMREKGYSFLGIDEKERSSLLSNFESDANVSTNIAPSIAESFLRRILGGS